VFPGEGSACCALTIMVASRGVVHQWVTVPSRSAIPHRSYYPYTGKAISLNFILCIVFSYIPKKMALHNT